MEIEAPGWAPLVPPWLEPLLKTKYFAHCEKHRELPRNEKNLFCAGCSDDSSAFCIYCRTEHHPDHRVIQIRRSSYHEVVRAVELEGLLDVNGVHTYVINSAKVFFLNERPQPRGVGAAAGKAAASPYFCEVCSRSLLNDFRFCSLGCKLMRIKSNGDASFVQGEEGSENSRVDGENSGKSSDSGELGDRSNLGRDENAGSLRPRTRRRKGIPQRSPLSS